jgi:hypothetical protein
VDGHIGGNAGESQDLAGLQAVDAWCDTEGYDRRAAIPENARVAEHQLGQPPTSREVSSMVHRPFPGSFPETVRTFTAVPDDKHHVVRA